MVKGRPRTRHGVPIPYGESVEKLRERLKAPGPEAWAAVAALAYCESPEAFDLLLELAGSLDWRFRRSALEALGSHPRGKEAAATILSALNDPSPPVARTACEVAAALRLENAHDGVLALLGSEEDATRLSAVHALDVLWRTTDAVAVYPLFTGDRSENVRREAARTLRNHATRSTWKTLFDAWKSSPLHHHRVWACELAEAYGDEGVRADLAELARDADGHVRKAAERALSRLPPL